MGHRNAAAHSFFIENNLLNLLNLREPVTPV